MMEADTEAECYEQWLENESDDCSCWSPTPPSDDAFLLSIHDTEDGPSAWFAVPQHNEPQKIYLSGSWVRNEDENRAVFGAVEKELQEKGYVVLNPTILPLGLTEAEYKKIMFSMVTVADSLVMLTGWDSSSGAMGEHRLAIVLGKRIIYQEQLEMIGQGEGREVA